MVGPELKLKFGTNARTYLKGSNSHMMANDPF
jgi:hypothetical protein